MKSIQTTICSVVLAGLSMTAMADTFSWVDNNGRKAYADRAPIGSKYSVTPHAKPADIPVQVPATPSSTYFPTQLASYDVDPRARVAYEAESASAIRERDRNQNRECLSIKHKIDRISSSRNFTVDPETGRSLEERTLKEANDLYGAVCRG